MRQGNFRFICTWSLCTDFLFPDAFTLKRAAIRLKQVYNHMKSNWSYVTLKMSFGFKQLNDLKLYCRTVTSNMTDRTREIRNIERSKLNWRKSIKGRHLLIRSIPCLQEFAAHMSSEIRRVLFTIFYYSDLFLLSYSYFGIIVFVFLLPNRCLKPKWR